MPVTPITSTPTLIDASAYNFFDSSIGPVLVGSDLYVALATLSGLGVRVQVVKSSDNGATWTREDNGSGSSILTNGIAAVFASVGVLFLFGGVFPIDTVDNTKVDEQSFLYATDLFQNLVVAGITFYGGALRAVVRSDDSAVATFSNTPDLSGIVFSGGSFGSPFTVETSATAQVCLIVDAADVAHSLYNLSGTVFYRTITGAGTVSGSIAIPDLPTADAGGVAEGGNLYYPYLDFTGPHLRVMFEVATGATSNPATATWSNYPVWTAGLDPLSEDGDPVAVMDGADAWVFWPNEDSAGINRIYAAKFNGAGFDAPIVYYDATLNPPAGSTIDPVILRIAIQKIGGAFVGVATIVISGGILKSYYLANGGAGYRHRVY